MWEQIDAVQEALSVQARHSERVERIAVLRPGKATGFASVRSPFLHFLLAKAGG